MIVKKVAPVISKTALDLNISEDKVNEVVNHLFKMMKDWVNNPTSGGLFLKELGTFYILDKSVYSALEQLVRSIRKSRKEKNKEKEDFYTLKFRHFWKLRILASMYRKSLKRPNCARIPRYLRKS